MYRVQTILAFESNVMWSAVFEINEDMILALAGQFKQLSPWAQQIDLLSTVWFHSSVG